LQSSNWARSVLSASPLKLISYVSGRTNASVPGQRSPRRHPISGDLGA